jgi:hypothetical protein
MSDHRLFLLVATKKVMEILYRESVFDGELSAVMLFTHGN